jgi:N-acetyl-anhydromuramyl-L-alanine amidase AmpD
MSREINLIIIHCTATPPEFDIDVETVRRWHIFERGFNDIGYHYLIKRDGTLESGRPVDMVGAHASGYNQNSIGVALVGGISKKGAAVNNFTNEQFDTLKKLLNELKSTYEGIKIIGHNEVSNKACPSFNVQEWLKAD